MATGLFGQETTALKLGRENTRRKVLNSAGSGGEMQWVHRKTLCQQNETTSWEKKLNNGWVVDGPVQTQKNCTNPQVCGLSPAHAVR